MHAAPLPQARANASLTGVRTWAQEIVATNLVFVRALPRKRVAPYSAKPVSGRVAASWIHAARPGALCSSNNACTLTLVSRHGNASSPQVALRRMLRLAHLVTSGQALMLPHSSSNTPAVRPSASPRLSAPPVVNELWQHAKLLKHAMASSNACEEKKEIVTLLALPDVFPCRHPRLIVLCSMPWFHVWVIVVLGTRVDHS